VLGDVEGYPGFDALFPEFQREWLRFWEFSQRTFEIPLRLDALNLTYVNYIHPDESLTTPMFVFNESEWRRELPELEFWASQFRFRFPDENLGLSVAARPAFRIATQESAASLEITLAALDVPRIDDIDAIFRWFYTAHAKVHWSFRSLVRPEWLAQWGFDEAD
ncbi:MAG: TIGR04255 family protein, partial [Candidatus Cybelea sp.]